MQLATDVGVRCRVPAFYACKPLNGCKADSSIGSLSLDSCKRVQVESAFGFVVGHVHSEASDTHEAARIQPAAPVACLCTAALSL